MSQSKGVITSCQQLVYLSQWFAEMSEMQRQDFQKYLLQKYGKCGQQSADNCLVNGFEQFGVSDRPASIFQCRMKLFSEWFAQWSDEEKAELLIRLRNIDSKFMDEFESSVETNANSQSTTGVDDDDLQSRLINGNVCDDSKSTEHLAMNGYNGQHIDDKESIDEELDVGADEPEVVDPPTDPIDAQEVVEVSEDNEEYAKTTDETIGSVMSESSEVPEVCG